MPTQSSLRTAVVLVNLGTPDSPTLAAVQRYLREFLLDKRIVPLNHVMWRPILETHIIHGHARNSAEKYKSVWYEDGSPLLVHTKALAAGLADALGATSVEPVGPLRATSSEPAVHVGATLSEAAVQVGATLSEPAARVGATSSEPAARVGATSSDPSDALGATLAEPAAPLVAGPLTVTYGMRYGQPALGTALATLQAAGVGRVLVVPLYPQYSSTTVATVIDAWSAHLARSQDHPEGRWIRAWATDAGYIDACARRVEEFWAERGRPDFAAGGKLLLSFHGIPVKAVAAGDPYPAECEATTDRIRERLGLGPEHCLMTYQSKFGHGEWLTPATIDTVGKLGELGTPRLDVFCPGFAADCLETLEEIGILNREEFAKAGGGEFNRIPCLNDSAPWVQALAGLVRANLGGWAEGAEGEPQASPEPVSSSGTGGRAGVPPEGQ